MLVYCIQNDRTEHTDSTKKTEIEKSVRGREIQKKLSEFDH